MLTFNIWNYTRPWDKRRDLIAELIRREQPDAVALQEIRHDFRYERGRGQGEQLAELTGYHPTSAIAQVYVPILRVDEGLTILTQKPPRRVEVRELTQIADERQDENHRVCLGVEIQARETPFWIFDAHFSLSARARTRNARECWEFVVVTAGSSPAVLMGDLNASPEEEAIAFLTGLRAVDQQRGDFVDCWTAARESAPGFTYASFGPRQRIDYVLGRNLPVIPQRADIVGGESRDGVYPSDHMGIVVDLDL